MTQSPASVMDTYLEQLMEEIWGDRSQIKFEQELPSWLANFLDQKQPWAGAELEQRIEQAYRDLLAILAPPKDPATPTFGQLTKLASKLPPPVAGETDTEFFFTFPSSDDLEAVLRGEKDLMDFQITAEEYRARVKSSSAATPKPNSSAVTKKPTSEPVKPPPFGYDYTYDD